jgi:hypothetical protein
MEAFANERSQGASNSNMDVDVKEEMDWKLNEDDLSGMLKVNLIKCIKRMQTSPKETSQFDIPLGRMVYMPLVRPTLDIKRFEAKFEHGYHIGANVFNVFLCNE